MEVIINGRARQLAGVSTLAAAVQTLTSAGTGVAAAVNGEVVPRTDWDATRLAPGDTVEVITAAQGG